MMNKKTLILFKTSSYDKYFNNEQITSALITAHKKYRFQTLCEAHKSHIKTLLRTIEILKKYSLHFDCSERETLVDYSRYSLVISVGGDGTFLKAASNINDQIMIGVNSSPQHSVGKLCFFHVNNLEHAIQAFTKDRFKITKLDRLELQAPFCKSKKKRLALNDILVCHQSPAAMSHYVLKINKHAEEQRGSGIWIATPAGSTGAISSAGGAAIPISKHQIQFLGRELYPFHKKVYRLSAGTLNKNTHITITSLMDDGQIFIDGTHNIVPFPFSKQIFISLSKHPVKLLTL